MQKAITSELSNDFLSSAHVFASAVRNVFEATVLQDVAGDKLSFSQLKLLYLVARTEGHTIGDAAAFLGVSNAAASKTVDKLVRRRLLRRSEIQADRRTSQLSITEASRRLLAAYEAARHEMATRIFDRFSAQELRQTAELLDRLAVAIVNHGTEPNELCLQCEIYSRENCRFGELSRRTCFYKRQKSDKQDNLDSRTSNPE